ncbi:TPA: flagellar hook-associated protein FlgK [Candidatus Poribacteria bacterium]|nr:flagellar hook-associated protein FlgK [Candidatus Poribacteria bacterium]HIO80969.1 flagellar hook-associated protein FlgK [Candidatus Poribacteria bacterium]
MNNLFSSLQIAKRALSTQRLGLSVAGHNISNVNTPNYARQQPLVEPGVGGAGMAGVEITYIRRVQDRVVDERLRLNTQELAKWQTLSDRLSQIETFFSDLAGIGLSGALSDFWNSWQDLTVSPESESSRLVAVQRGVVLASRLQGMNAGMEESHIDLDAEINRKITETNEITTRIGKLNQEIISIELSGSQANDQRTLRDYQLAQLSELINFRTIERKGGSVQVFVDSLSLVEGVRVTELVAQLTADSNEGSTSTASTKILASNNEVAVSGGALAGLIEARDQHLPSMLTRMKTLSESLITQINKLHRLGYGLDNSTGLEFFSGTSIDDITVNSELLADPKKLGVSGEVSAPGNNETALEIAQLQTSLTIGATVIPDDRQTLTVESTDGWSKNDILGVVGSSDLNRTGTWAKILSVDSGTQVTVKLFQNPTTKTFNKRFNFEQEDGSTTVLTNKVYKDFDGNYMTIDPNPTDELDIDQLANLPADPETEAFPENKLFQQWGGGVANSSVMTGLPQTFTSNEVFTEGTQTFNDYFAIMFSFIGTQSQQAQRNSDNNELLVQQLTDYREKVSGVSLDEEMANLIQFQRAFEASARYIRIVDEMLATLMNM